MSKNRSIEYISDKMDSKPTEFRIKGEHCSKRNPKSKIREENLWILKSKLGEQELLESVEVIQNKSYHLRFIINCERI